jgi:hypothetical protein
MPEADGSGCGGYQQQPEARETGRGSLHSRKIM